MNGDVIGNDNDEHDVELCKLVLKSENSKLNLPQGKVQKKKIEKKTNKC